MKFDFLKLNGNQLPESSHLVQGLLDDEGRRLYYQLKDIFNIRFRHSNELAIAVSINGRDVDIYIPRRVKTIPPLFTHELYHLLLITHGISNYNCILVKMNEYSLVEYFSTSLHNWVFLANFLDHAIMFDLFMDAGYSEDEFVADYYEDKFESQTEDFLINSFVSSKPSANGIGFYISKFVGLSSPAGFKKDYSYAYAILKRLDSELYGICDSFMKSYWYIIKCDFTVIRESYIFIIEDFMESLSAYIEKHKSSLT